MAMSFLKPRPGDGAYLLQARGHQGPRKKRFTFLRQDPAAESENEVYPQGKSDAVPRTFLRPAKPAAPPITPNLAPTLEPDLTHDLKSLLNVHQPPAQDTANYVLEADRAAQGQPLDDMAGPTLPPHLRGKKPTKSAQGDSPPIDEITAKLSNLGCKVTAPQPADSAHEGHDENDEVSVFRGRNNRQSQRGRPSWGGRWPKNSEIPKPDPKMHEIKWEGYTSSSGGWADAGLGDGKTKRAPPEATQGYELTDFDGNWAPAPINWDARPAFRDDTKISQIDKWHSAYEAAVSESSRLIAKEQLHEDASSPPELAPRYWIPDPAIFSEVLKSTEPSALDDGDLDGAKPWWETYTTADGCCIKPYNHQHPDHAGIDPDENQDERLTREADFGSAQAAENRKRFELAKRQALTQKQLRQQEKARKAAEAVRQNPEVNADRIKPQVNIYVRSAKPADMSQIKDIYNYYIDFTVAAPEIERRTAADMATRYQRSISNRLPYIVAVVRGGRVPARKKKAKGRQYGDGDDMFLPDQVVGFAAADDFHDMTSMYRFTTEIEVFVHKEFTGKCVATCLLDKLMAMLDQGYIERGGFEIIGDELDSGPGRLVEGLTIHVPYETEKGFEWKERMLKSWGFSQSGDLKDIGVKLESKVSLAIFQRKTSFEIDPKVPPVAMAYPTS